MLAWDRTADDARVGLQLTRIFSWDNDDDDDDDNIWYDYISIDNCQQVCYIRAYIRASIKDTIAVILY